MTSGEALPGDDTVGNECAGRLSIISLVYFCSCNIIPLLMLSQDVQALAKCNCNQMSSGALTFDMFVID